MELEQTSETSLNDDSRSTSGGIHALRCPSCERAFPRLIAGMRFCQYCGERIDSHHSETRGPFKSSPAPRMHHQCFSPKLRSECISRARCTSREGRIAGALSVVPGLGQVYNGQFFQGVAFFGSSVLLAPVGIGLIIWAYGIIHAHRHGAAREAAESSRPRPPSDLLTARR